MADNPRPGEFELIERYFAPLAGPGGLGEGGEARQRGQALVGLVGLRRNRSHGVALRGVARRGRRARRSGTL